ncbi:MULTISPECIES: hypothetical protein [unclassified Pseudofrankia]|uniref:hypothetical protein n=1 Tax=unclassified Pseudofrankia TaxID=2994372 RepID=UPI0008D9D75D|nr:MULTISPECIES: hypothetical protein [unclassified Pseudofrankia]MDT3445644.1 hypothetical protein [Pseudofrankia sp. BMG5.37]OHV63513.1 hypothetical protein BCD48_37940 [Pseudofrankia sp. BMG5.36]
MRWESAALLGHARQPDVVPDVRGGRLLALGLILSFSAGLAAVLMSLGLLLVRSRSLVAHLGRFDRSWSAALPIVTAVVVTALGLKGIGVTGPV